MYTSVKVTWIPVLRGIILMLLLHIAFYCYCLTLVFFFPISLTDPMKETIMCTHGKGTSLLKRDSNFICKAAHCYYTW